MRSRRGRGKCMRREEYNGDALAKKIIREMPKSIGFSFNVFPYHCVHRGVQGEEGLCEIELLILFCHN